MTGNRHIDVLVTGATGSWQWYMQYLGANGGVIFMRGATAGAQRRPAHSSPLLSKYIERSAVGLPGAGQGTAIISEVCRLAEAEKLLPREPRARMNGIAFSKHL